MDEAKSLILFGATGDLAKRMLLPSLYGLEADGLLPADLRIVATARTELADGDFRVIAADAVKKAVEAERLVPAKLDQLLARIHYVPVDVTNPAHFDRLAKAADLKRGRVAMFLSMAPSLFAAAIEGLRHAGVTEPNGRLALEKPLGSDLASSRAINDAVAAAVPEHRTFRIDHYLGKETVQNVLALRFGNVLFEPLWNAVGVEHVQITVSETVGLEGRTDFYDQTGALRDMVQNHLLQLLSLVAMEPPANLSATEVRDEKVKVLRSLRPIDRTTATDHLVLGQYTEGAVGGALVKGYADDLGRPSETETFVALKAHVDNWRWRGVPFYLRTGKRLPARKSEILIQFRDVPHSIFAKRGAALEPNRLIIQLQPEENIRLMLMTKQPGLDREGMRLREAPLDVSIPNAFSGARRRIAYERLLLDLIQGDPTLFVRRDEVEAQWEWVDAIRDGWTYNGMTPKPYAAGTWGPSAAIALTERDGVSWRD